MFAPKQHKEQGKQVQKQKKQQKSNSKASEDRFEKKADKVADQVVSGAKNQNIDAAPTPPIQTMKVGQELDNESENATQEEEVQLKEKGIDEQEAIQLKEFRDIHTIDKFQLKKNPDLNKPEIQLKENPTLNQPEIQLKKNPTLNQPEIQLKKNPTLNQPEILLKKNPTPNRPEIQLKSKKSLSDRDLDKDDESIEGDLNKKSERLREKARSRIEYGNQIRNEFYWDEIPYVGKRGVIMKLKRRWVKEKYWKYYAEWLVENGFFEKIESYSDFLALDGKTDPDYFNVFFTLPERNLSGGVANKKGKLNEPSGTVEQETQKVVPEPTEETVNIYSFTFEKDYTHRLDWQNLTAREIVEDKLGGNYEEVYQQFLSKNPNDSKWMEGWIKQCIVEKKWDLGDPPRDIHEIVVTGHPVTGEAVIEAFSFSDARRKAKDIGIQKYETFYWKRKISGEMEHFMKGYRGPEVYYNQRHLEGKNYETLVDELFKISGNEVAYEKALAEGKIDHAFTELVKSAQEIVFFDKPNQKELMDGMYGNDTRTAIVDYLKEIEGRDPYWEAMVRRFANEKGMDLASARQAVSEFWMSNRESLDVAAYEDMLSPGYDTIYKVAAHNQSYDMAKHIYETYHDHKLEGLIAEYQVEADSIYNSHIRPEEQISDELLEQYPVPKYILKRDEEYRAERIREQEYKKTWGYLEHKNIFAPDATTVLPGYINPTTSEEYDPFGQSEYDHPYKPDIDPLKPYNRQLIDRFHYWVEWENEQQEIDKIKNQPQNQAELEDQYRLMEEQFIISASKELGYDSSDESVPTVYLSEDEQWQQKTFFDAWNELKLAEIKLSDKSKKDGSFADELDLKFEMFVGLLSSHDHHAPFGRDEYAAFYDDYHSGVPRTYEGYQALMKKLTSDMRMIIQKDIRLLPDNDENWQLKQLEKSFGSNFSILDLINKEKTKAQRAGHTFEKIPAIFSGGKSALNSAPETSFRSAYTNLDGGTGHEIEMYVEKSKSGSLSLHLFLGTSEDRHFTFEGSSIQGALQTLNEQKGILNYGLIRYTYNNKRYFFTVNPPSWTWSEALGVASIVLGVLAIPFTGGASTVLIIGATAAGIGSSAAYLYDKNAIGQLTTGDIALESGYMIANLLPMVRGVSMLTKSAQMSSRLGKFVQIAKGNTFLKVTLGADIGMTGIEGLVIADTYMSQLAEINQRTDIDESEKDRMRADVLYRGISLGLITLVGLTDGASSWRKRNKKHWNDGSHHSTETINKQLPTQDYRVPDKSVDITLDKTITSSDLPEETNINYSKGKTTEVTVIQDKYGVYWKRYSDTGYLEKLTSDEFNNLFSKSLKTEVRTERKETINVYHAKSTDYVQSVIDKIDSKYFSPDSRFGSGFYVAEKGEVAIAEVKHHGTDPVKTKVIRFELDITSLNTLDLTDENIAKKWNLDEAIDFENKMINQGDEELKYGLFQEIAERAKEEGFNAIRFKSFRENGNNFVILEQNNTIYKEILTPQMVVPASE